MKPEPDQRESDTVTVAVDGEALEQLLAQKPPAIVIGQLSAAGPRFSSTRYRIPDDGVFIEGNHLTEAGLIENIAQTIGAGSGFMRKQEGKAIIQGYLAMVKNLKISRLPGCGEEIRTEVSFVNKALDCRIFDCRVQCGAEQITTCELRIYIP